MSVGTVPIHDRVGKARGVAARFGGRGFEQVGDSLATLRVIQSAAVADRPQGPRSSVRGAVRCGARSVSARPGGSGDAQGCVAGALPFQSRRVSALQRQGSEGVSVRAARAPRLPWRVRDACRKTLDHPRQHLRTLWWPLESTHAETHHLRTAAHRRLPRVEQGPHGANAHARANAHLSDDFARPGSGSDAGRAAGRRSAGFAALGVGPILDSDSRLAGAARGAETRAA